MASLVQLYVCGAHPHSWGKKCFIPYHCCVIALLWMSFNIYVGGHVHSSPSDTFARGELQCRRWYGRSKCETHGAQSIRPLVGEPLFSDDSQTYTWEYQVAVSSQMHFSPETTEVGEPKEHFVFPRKTSSSVRNTDQTRLSTAWVIFLKLWVQFPNAVATRNEGCQPLCSMSSHVFKFLTPFSISKNGESGMYRSK